MRLWSLHPKYLDSKGLVALWREALLARHVLEGKTKGYKNHPQLNRFKNSASPVDAVHYYLTFVYNESKARGYNFDKSKINWRCKKIKLKVTRGQIDYEVTHLLKKLKIRDSKKYKELKSVKRFKPHPMFGIVKGEIENWETL